MKKLFVGLFVFIFLVVLIYLLNFDFFSNKAPRTFETELTANSTSPIVVEESLEPDSHSSEDVDSSSNTEASETPKLPRDVADLQRTLIRIAAENELEIAYEEIIRLVTAYPRTLGQIAKLDDALFAAAQFLSTQVKTQEEKAFLFERATEDFIDSLTTNVQQFALGITLEGCRKGYLTSMGKAYLEKYQSSTDYNQQLSLLKHSSSSLNSEYVLQMAIEELYSKPDTASSYPGLSNSLEAFKSLLLSESRSRYFLEEFPDSSDIPVRKFYKSIEDVPDSSAEIGEALLEVANDQSIKPIMLSIVGRFIRENVPEIGKDIGKGVNYEFERCEEIAMSLNAMRVIKVNKWKKHLKHMEQITPKD